MKTPIQIASNLALPLDAVTQTIAIIGIRGSGKTNSGVVISEQLLSEGQQVVILDPVDVWWGLKSSKDGKAPAFAIPIIGGEHADVPLEGTGGSIIADFVVDNRASAIISLRHLSINEQRRFATEFARRLYERKGVAEFRSPMMLVVDEADEFIPQRIPPGHEAMFGAFDRIARRGRSSGLGMIAITQRPQVMNKDVLSQMEVLIAHRVLHKLDRGALDAWIEAHDTAGRREEFMASLASLERGDAWVWSPSWLDVFKRVHINARSTYDSSATPKAGEHIATPKRIAEVDLAKLGDKLRASVEAAKANDPRELKRRLEEALEKIGKLESVKQKVTEPDSLLVKRARDQGAASVKAELGKQLKVYGAFWKKRIAQAQKAFEATGLACMEGLKACEEGEEPELPGMDSIIETAEIGASADLVRQMAGGDVQQFADRMNAYTPPIRQTVQLNGEAKDLSVPAQKILAALAEFEYLRFPKAPRTLVALRVGYTNTASTGFAKAMSNLSARGFIGYPNSNEVALTDSGRALVPVPTRGLLAAELQSATLSLIGGKKAEMLKFIMDVFPSAISKDVLMRSSGYTNEASTGFVKALSTLSGFGLIEYPERGMIRAKKFMFLEAE